MRRKESVRGCERLGASQFGFRTVLNGEDDQPARHATDEPPETANDRSSAGHPVLSQ